MTFERSFRRNLLLVLTCSVAAYTFAADVPLILLVAVVLGGIGWVLSEGSHARPIPHYIINVLVLMAVSWAMIIGFDRGLDVERFSEFVIAVLIIKMFEHKRARDFGQCIVLGIFLMVGAILTSNELAVGLLLMVQVPLVLRLVLLFQVYAARERVARSSGRLDEVEHIPVGMGERPRRSLVMTVASSCVLMSVISIITFFTMPRGLGNETFGRWGNASLGTQVGFTDVVTLGTGGLISDDTTPVLDLEVRDTEGTNLGAMGQTYYLGGAILDVYKPLAGVWTSSSSADADGVDMYTSIPYSLGHASEGADSRTLVQSISIRNVPDRRSHLFAIRRPLSIRYEQPSKLHVMGMDRDVGGGMLERSGQRGKFRYVVRSEQLLAVPEAASRRVTTTFDSEVVREFASRILQDEGIEPDPALRSPREDFAACRALESYLRREFDYTLDLKRAPSGRDPVEWFLVDEQRGHCEYFASAMTSMARSIGVNARVVTGFVATEFNDASGAYTVRQSNAHAWVECEIKPLVFWRYDPTPPGEFRRIHQPDPTVFTTAMHWLEAVEYAWIRNVIGFDEEKRLAVLGGTFGSSIRERVDAVNMNLDTGRLQLVLRAGANAFLAFGVSLLLGVGTIEGVRYLRRRWRRRAWLGASEDDLDASRRRKQAMFYEQYLELLDRLSPKPAWSPPLRHAERIAEPARTPARDIARAFYTLRFGRRVLSDQELEDVRKSLETLRRVAEGGPAPT